MGASPLGITVGLSLCGDIAINWVEQLYQGITHCLKQYNTSLVGGDVCRSPVVTVSITAFGQVFPNRTLRRAAAKVGDAIVVTGVHGASRAGLELLLNPVCGKHLSQAERMSLIHAHQRPKPRLDVLPLLWKILNSDSRLPTPDSPIPFAAIQRQYCHKHSSEDKGHNSETPSRCLVPSEANH